MAKKKKAKKSAAKSTPKAVIPENLVAGRFCIVLKDGSVKPEPLFSSKEEAQKVCGPDDSVEAASNHLATHYHIYDPIRGTWAIEAIVVPKAEARSLKSALNSLRRALAADVKHTEKGLKILDGGYRKDRADILADLRKASQDQKLFERFSRQFT